MIGEAGDGSVVRLRMGTTETWKGDAVGLVEAFRSGERSPEEELQATFAAIEASDLNAVCFTDAEAALVAARQADVSLPFGGVPIGVKELDEVAGWPNTHASVPFADQVGTVMDTKIQRLVDAGAVLACQTTASEFGGVNQTNTKLHGATRNPWDPERTPGGSSGGSSAAVAGGLVPIATGGDGGGSIRIPAGFTGLLGLKATYGRIPLGPAIGPGNLTVNAGCLSRSVRDTARWFDVSNGFDLRDPLSLPRVEGWEAGLGSFVDGLNGRRATVLTDMGAATVGTETTELVEAFASWLIDELGLRRVETTTKMPRSGGAWSATGGVGLYRTVRDRWPDCGPDLTGAMRAGVSATLDRYDVKVAARAEDERIALNEAMADLFTDADIVFAATNPSVAFNADGHLPSTFGDKEASPINHGLLTIPSNIYGNPAVSIPIGTSAAGLPVGIQVLAPHFAEQILLDIGLVVERARPWPLVAPGC